MESDNGGQSLGGSQMSNDLQRRAAAEIARKKVLAAYAGRAQQMGSGRQDVSDVGARSVSSTEMRSGMEVRGSMNAQSNMRVQNGMTAQSSGASHMKDVPMQSKINSESWKKYHSAWQDYYQKYYSEYYSNVAREYIAKERLKDARAQAEEDEIVYALTKASGGKGESKMGLALGQGSASDSSDSNLVDGNGIREQLRRKVRSRATDSAKKTRRFRKFIPLMAGVAVVLLILFLQYNRLIFAPIMAYVSPGNVPASEIEAIDPTITQVVSPESRLIIPKLNVDVPVDMDVDLNGVMDAMVNGVAHYRIAGASAYPGEIGNFIITGHSAGDVYSSSPYKYIFSGLERLAEGDLIYVNYKSVRYTYQVTKKEVIEPTNVAALVVQTDKPLITLVTCTPLGTSRYRLLVTGEQISPVWDENTANEQEASQATPIIEDVKEMPANEPSFFEGIWNWLTGA
ncbi:class E sortase [Candidatus Saccharibacteria bacterium]|nr:class E sortase [Candidatus Saccharibacteria bacterium]